MAREVRLWEWLRDATRPIEGLHICRVENSVLPGYPDVEGCYQGRGFHIELKGCERRANGTICDFEGISPEQRVWLHRRRLCGGWAWVYIRVGIRQTLKRYLISGEHAIEIQPGLPESRLAELSVLHPEHDARTVVLAAVGLWEDKLV